MNPIYVVYVSPMRIRTVYLFVLLLCEMLLYYYY